MVILEEEETDWHKIQITDKAIEDAVKTHNLNEDDAFDYLLELLELGSTLRLDGINSYEVKMYRAEKEYLLIQKQKLIHYYQGEYPRKLRSKLHYAEDGRCEECSRAMDKRVVCLKRLDPSLINEFNNYLLLCPDCKNDHGDPLTDAEFSKESLTTYRNLRGIELEDARTELLAMKSHLVLVQVKKNRRYWLPGLGRIVLEDGILNFDRLDKTIITFKEKKQERSRRWAVEDSANA